MPPHTADTVLSTKFISYATPLQLARRWSQTGDAGDRNEALKLLQGLFNRFPHSVEIGQLLALAHLEIQDEASATAVLSELQLLSRNPNEEVLSRSGRVFRDRGDRSVAYPRYAGPPVVNIGGPTDSPADALRFYRLALQEYSKAYEIRLGHYPGVNKATLHLLIAALEPNQGERDSQLDSSGSTAKSLLSRRAEWPHDHHDDPIWHAGSEGELHLLLQEWNKAADCYRAALSHAKCQQFHCGSMLKQVIRIVHCHGRLGVADLGDFSDLKKVFC